jgi:hypothetical protein
MNTASPLIRSLLLLAAWSFAVASASANANLDATVRQLEKDITAVRGLPFKTPVVAKIIPRPKDAEKHLQGYYSIKARQKGDTVNKAMRITTPPFHLKRVQDPQSIKSGLKRQRPNS